MPSTSWLALGTGEVLGHLRADFKGAKSLVQIIGPWIDAFFADVVISTVPSEVGLHVLTRPASGGIGGFEDHASAARAAFERRPRSTVRLLDALHAKAIIIDESITYCGSANWYRYSLEQSRELVLKGAAEQVRGLLDQVQVLWDAGDAVDVFEEATAPQQPSPRKVPMRDLARGYSREVLDPIAAAKLREVPGSFVLKGHSGRTPRRR